MKCHTNLTPAYLPRHLRFLLRLFAGRRSLSVGQQLHAVVLSSGAASAPNTFLVNALLHLYALCGATRCARHLFDEIPHSRKDAADWTALLTCLARHGTTVAGSFSLFREMRREGVVVDDVVVVCVLSLCARSGDLGMGRQVHGCVVRMGLRFSVKTWNAVLNMYMKCGSVAEGRRVFSEMEERNVISWSTLLDGVVNWEGVENGKVVFDEMPERNEVGWTIMIAGYVGSGFTKEGILLLNELVSGLGLNLNCVTLCSILTACAQSGDVETGRWVHVFALKAAGWEMDIKVGTALVDMYSKCGRINIAYVIFECMSKRNVVAWNAMLGGLAMHGKGKTVLNIFPKMIEEAEPDDLTFMAVLSACSHAGLVDQGYHYFHVLESKYNITPKVEHYACMVDLLGRAGHLEEAEILVRKMPMPPNEVVLGSLLGSCSVHGNLQLGEQILQELVDMDPQNTEFQILLSNMYALSGKQHKANSLRQVLMSKGIRKVPGMSSIHVNGQVHQFSAGEKSHPRIQEIYLAMDDMIRRLRLAGYVPNTTSQVFSGSNDGEENPEEREEKEQALFSHSEKLAVCFGLISTRPGAPLYIFKNLRICRDCHSAIKIASLIYKREIVVRDRNRFHCFKYGSCSCSDYW